MTIDQIDAQTEKKPLRLWPGVVIVVLQWLARFGLPAIAAKYLGFGLLGGIVGLLAVVVWWAFFSRASRSERWGGAVLMIFALVAIVFVVGHESLFGMPFFGYTIPVFSLVFVAGVALSRRLTGGRRRAAIGAAVLLAGGMWTLIRSDGATGALEVDFAWRWAETTEDRLLAGADDEVLAPPSVLTATETGADWPGFRGPHRDGSVPGVRIETDWSASPPVEIWRRPIGPGWGSFAVRGNLFYTQEQRGEDEFVSCYDATTGMPVWRHGDPARFFETMGGAGPRATPTLSGSRVYTFGATGILNALDASDGAVVWSRNAASDAEAKVPFWGFSSSPLVVDDLVIVNTGVLGAYDLATGEPRWFGPAAEKPSSMHMSYYSSPHRLTLDGVEQVVQLSPAGATGLSPVGSTLWEHPWSGIPQPAMTADGDVLIGTESGTRRIAVAHGPGGWTVEKRWTSAGLRPGFNDFVVHDGYAFGFDGAVLACIDVEDGELKWKGERYGHGQLVLLPDQGLLLVMSEQGELALVAATPDRFTELARFAAIEGKTWNHPVLVGDVLLVRNDREMAAFQLSLAGG